MRLKQICVLGLAVCAVLLSSGCSMFGGAGKGSPVNHIVLVSFKEGTTSATVDKVMADCRKFPDSIPGFVGYQGGGNNSPEGLEQSFSHGLLMTFENQAALDAYGPNPVHQALVKFAKPHFKEVFVFDFPVPEAPPGEAGNVQHLVFFRFKSDVDAATLEEVHRQFAALPDKIPGLLHYQGGKSTGAPERAKGLTHGYVLTFTGAEARDRYIPHPEHQEFVGFIKPLLDGVLVLDFTTS